MSNERSFWGGMNAFIVGAIVSFFLFMSVALSGEYLVTAFENSVMYDVNPAWASGYSDTIFFMNILYIICVAPVVIGLIIWVLGAVKTQDYDVLGNPDENGQLTQYNVPPNITPEELGFYGGR